MKLKENLDTKGNTRRQTTEYVAWLHIHVTGLMFRLYKELKIIKQYEVGPLNGGL